MSARKILIRRCFNRASQTYDQYAALQQQTGHRLIERVQSIAPQFDSIMDLGCGTGMVTAALAAGVISRRFHAVDMASRLLDQARKRLWGTSIQLEEADFEQPFSDLAGFDLVFSNLALHWSASLTSVFQNIWSMLNAKGYLIFSVPVAGTFKELSHFAARQSFCEAQQVAGRLSSLGFDVLDGGQETLTYDFPDTLTALRSIKRVVANFANRCAPHLRGKSWLNKLDITQLTYRSE